MINPTDINATLFNMQGRRLESLDEYSVNTKDNEKLKKAASDFEAVFVSKMLDIMDSTVEKADFLNGGDAEATFKSMMNQEIAKSVASNPATSVGLAEQIYRQMKDRM